MLLINHPPLGQKSPSYLKTLAALQAVSDSPSAFFTTGAPGDAEREELMLGTKLFDLPIARRAYLYLLRAFIGRCVPEAMTSDHLGKQLLLAAQLFAEARNVFAKSGKPQEELIAFFLAVRCGLRSEVGLPDYLEVMATNYAKAIGARAETLAYSLLNEHDLKGFLAMITIAFSAYEDNAIPLGAAEHKRYSGLTVSTLTGLVEYLKAEQDALSAIDVAAIQRTIALLALTRRTDILPSWLHEVVDRAPGRAVTIFLQEAAAQDKKRKIASSAWWWSHAAETLTFEADYEEWQQSFKLTASNEAAKRLGELAVKERELKKDLHVYASLASHTYRVVREMEDLPVRWLAGFRKDEIRNVMSNIYDIEKPKEINAPKLGGGIDAVLCMNIAKIEKENVVMAALGRLALARLVEVNENQTIEV